MRAYEPNRKFRIINSITGECRDVLSVDAREFLATGEWTQPTTFNISNAKTGEIVKTTNPEAVVLVACGKFSWVPA